jgi:hypothetical protein
LLVSIIESTRPVNPFATPLSGHRRRLCQPFQDLFPELQRLAEMFLILDELPV